VHSSPEESKQLPATIGRFIWHYLRHKKKFLAGYFFVELLWAVEMSFSPYLLKVIIDTVVKYSYMPDKLLHMIVLPITLYASMSFILNLNFRLYNYLNLKLNPKLKSVIQQDVFSYLLQHSYSFFQDHFVGSITRKIADLVASIELLIAIPMELFISRGLAAVIASITLFHAVHPMFGLILLVWAVVFVYLSYLASKHSGVLSKQTSEAFTELDGSTSDAIQNVMSVKLFDNIAYQIAYVGKSLSKLVKLDRLFQWYNLKVYFIQGLGVTALMVSMLLGLLYGMRAGFVSAGDFALVVMISTAFMEAVHDLGNQMQRFSKLKGTCTQALSFIQAPHEVQDAPDAYELEVTEGVIDFNNVMFSYANHKPLFNQLTVRIQPGEKVGLVGYSGGGKSTFIKLILRLLDINSGEILIDGQAIKQVTKSSLRRQIGIIPQESELFHQTVFENIQFARPDAFDCEVIEASKKARCHDFIMALPEQYQTLVGERGVKLSGGQKQRMAIARAFLKSAPILLLDEATSALDSVTEKEIHDALHQLMKNKTTLVIAHRLATLKDMDRILVFVEGEIREDGSLLSLLQNKDSIFYNLWHMQASGFISESEDE
jgi:ATP-binding cassette, subfamily B, bacterial